jgi:hypothetical protein
LVGSNITLINSVITFVSDMRCGSDSVGKREMVVVGETWNKQKGF